MRICFILPFIIFSVFAGNNSFGQAQKVDSILELYANKYQPEKIHVHFDKYIYNKGETIWFKAYILNGTELSALSKNFYIDFFDNSGNLLKHYVNPVFQSSSSGQFEIPAAYTGSFIHVKAYTQWMLNFDSAFNYTKDIVVVQNKTPKAPVSESTTSIHFFPEGGDLVEGLSSHIGFLAVNALGRPVEVKGKIQNSKGELIDSFKSEHDGMGSFQLEVKPNEKYTVQWKDSHGKLYSNLLPAAKTGGINMSVQQLSDKSLVMINKTANADESSKSVYIVASFAQHLVYRSKLNLGTRNSGFVEIPTQNLPTGVMQITIFNINWVPLAERVVFVNNHNHEFITDIAAGIKNMSRKGKNIFEIYVSDTIPCNLSVSITDADLATEKNNIISQFLLCDDIKGYIHNPSYYFDSESDSVVRHLDLVMMTHGWRRFNWKDAFSGIGPTLPYAKDSDYLQIKGKFFTSTNQRIAANQQIFLIMQGKDSSKQSLILPVSSNGTFLKRGYIFYDTMKVYFSFMGDQKFEDNSALTLQNGLLEPQKAILSSNYVSPYLLPLYDSVLAERLKYFALKQAELDKLMKTTTLKDVVVTAKAKSPLEVLDQKYSNGLFAGGDAYQFDLTNDTRASGMLSVFDYLRGSVPGLTVTQGGGGASNYQLSWRGGTPDVFLDENKADVSMVSNLPMSDIAYIKVFRPPFFGSVGGGAGGAIAVYTKRGGDSKPEPGKGLSYKMLGGYSSFKQFYSPDYSGQAQNFTPDTRTTLFWKPFILTDAHNRKAKIEFYNNDISKRLRVIVEGFNADGVLTRTEKVIE